MTFEQSLQGELVIHYAYVITAIVAAALPVIITYLAPKNTAG